MDLRSHFGCHATPFTREVRAADCWHPPHFDDVTDALLRTIERRESAVLIAPAGTGKTTIARLIRDQLPEARYDVHYLKTAGLGRRDLCRELATALRTVPAGNYPALVRQIQERFENSLASDGRRPVVIADDVHELRPDALGVFKVISNFDMDSRLVVSILLVGQPPLRHLLERADLEDVAQRLVHCAELRLLSRDETREYVAHRLTVAGATKTPFDEGAFDALYELSRGNLRAIDRLALKALELAADKGQAVVGTAELVEARKGILP